MCGAVMYSDDGVCETCDPRRAPLPPLNAGLRPRRDWRWYAGKYLEAAVPILVDALVEVGVEMAVAAVTGCLLGSSDEADVESESPDGSGASQSARGSAVRPGRMRQTDKVKGADSPLPNKPGIYQHINKETGDREYVGQTNDLRVRQQQHVRCGKLDPETQYIRFAVAREDATKDDLCQTEIDHIARHNPAGNTTRGGNGRR